MTKKTNHIGRNFGFVELVKAQYFTRKYQRNIVDTIIMKINKKVLKGLKDEFKDSKYWNNYKLREQSRKLKTPYSLWKRIRTITLLEEHLQERILSIEYEVVCEGFNIQQYISPEKFKATKWLHGH